MRYCGSKRRFMKELKPILMEHIANGDCNTFVDAFMGGANVICDIDCENKVGIEYNKYVTALWKHIKDFGMCRIPMALTEEGYYDVKTDYVNHGNKYPDYIIGYVGSALSWGGAWFNGYPHFNPKKNEDHIGEAYRGLEKQVNDFINLDKTTFLNLSYDEYDYHDKCVIYADPPYAETKSYESDFDHTKFWEWVRKMSKKGHYVYVSEYTAPDDFKCIWEKKKKDGMGTTKSGKKQNTKVERLFVYNGK